MTDVDLDALIADMTFEEKVAQLGSVMVTDLMTDGALDETKAREALGRGVGQVARPAALSGRGPRETAELTNRIQRTVLAHSPVPALFHDECLAGLLAQGATTFPQPIGLGCTWEPALVGEMAAALREQARAVGVRLGLSPVFDVLRDPRWGRAEETYGEEPFLTTQFGLAYVRGLQSSEGDLTDGVAATGKHFLGHGQPQGGRNWAPCMIPERELREVHLTPFKAAVQEAGLAAVMTTYHSRDGVPSAADAHLTNGVLRGEAGFAGVVVSDYHNTRMLRDYHHTAADAATASAQTLLAGTDVELPGLDQFGSLGGAVARGLVTLEDIERAVRRVLALKARLGLFARPYVDADAAPRHFGTSAQRRLSRTLARASLVLLRNDDLLPLSPDIGSVAVIGPSADSRRLLQGDYHFPSHMEDLFSSEVDPDSPNPQAQVFRGPIDDLFPPSVTVLEGVRAAVSAETQVHYARGCDITGEDDTGVPEAALAAERAEVAIVVVGERSGISAASTCGESRDRAMLGLLGQQRALIDAVRATGTPTAVVLLSGRPLALTWTDHVGALLYAGVPAQEGGGAVADALFGRVNPGGKLCATFPRGVGQIPLHVGLSYAGARTHWRGTYVDADVTPLHPFGHGLSYTRFRYEALELSRREVPVGETIRVSFDLHNSGERAGDEVAQLYVHDKVASAVRPAQQLVGFKRVHLEPGERARLTFHLDTRLLAFYNRDMRLVAEPGEIALMLGSSSADIRLRGTFTLTGDVTEVAQVFSTPVEVEVTPPA